MGKIHGRERRYMSIAPRLRKPRPRSFKSEDTAKKWADSKGIKNFTLKDLRRPGANDKKIVIIETHS